MHAVPPKDIKLHAKSKTLELIYSDQQQFELSAEYLRVHSPSAEVRGHGVGNGVLQTGKQLVGIKGLEAVGNYALKITFDDGHDSGLFTWEYLLDLCQHYDSYWNRYLAELSKAGKTRHANMIAKG
ncbi:DUF971 domain-containing protein [Amphritea sp. 1_MG-2023]|uniref:DUF971 domain-containing protein n=1 Tax=Amphritea sp. 1_MG-2023 TaxID=3062670 RepID=UPI0026E300B6|nr:DUF971 domain-containing protein [Amphritea sp. 1_MG-2023]MDO6563026.1 DUF971 domain-containing protein [Amphritea sp. 1_MG-2023]